MARNGTRLLAVLIDADNVSAAHAEAILAEIATLGEPGLRRVYGDWSSAALSNWKKKARDLGVVMHQQSANTRGKNASDIGLVIAAMDFLHSGLFDGFVLVSSDSDFTRLAARIREQGLDVFGIGEQKTPEAFRMACKRFIYVENLVTGPEPAIQASPPAAPREAPKNATGKEPAVKAIPLIVAAMRAIGGDEDWYSLGQVGQFIVQANPDFDTRTYGSAKLSDLLRKISRFEVKADAANHLMVRDLA